MLTGAKKTIRNTYCILAFLFVQVFRWPFYQSKYLKGKWFYRPYSLGWQQAANDIIHRIFFLKNANVPWPVSPYIGCCKNIEFDVDDMNNFWGSGNYYQAFDAKIIIGKGCWIAKNVGIITSNHDFDNLEMHCRGRDVILGERCWVGMNSMILPGVILGPHTVVGAGSVVTKSFPMGNVIIAGNPARVIRDLDEKPNSEQLV